METTIFFGIASILVGFFLLWLYTKDKKDPLVLITKDEEKLDDEHQVIAEPIVAEKAEKAPVKTVKAKKPSVRKPRATKKLVEENVETQ